MIDSGSVCTYINKATAESLNLFIIPKDKSVSLADDSHKAKIVGEVVVDLTLKERIIPGIVIEVIENLFIDVIIGKDLLRRHKKVTFNFGGPGKELIIGAVSNHFPEMNVEPPSLFENLSPNIKPIATKSRRYSNEDTKFIKEETQRMLKQGIITESNSPWRAQVLVVKSEGHKKRLVVDYSNTINIHTELDAYPLPNLNDMVNEISKYKYYSTFDLKAAYHQVPIRKADRKFTAFQSGNKLYEFTRIPFGITNGVSAFQRIMDKIIDEEKLESTFVFVDNVIIAGNSKQELSDNVNAYQSSAKKYNSTFNSDKSIEAAEELNTLGVSISHNRISPDYSRLKPLLEMTAPTSLKAQKRIIGMFSYYSKYIKDFSRKIRPLNSNKVFPVPMEVLESFEQLKHGLKDATLVTVDPTKKFVVETDASDYCIAATLNQEGRPVAFFSRTLNKHEIKQHAVEKEAAAVVEALKTWRHYLLGQKFEVVTDQRSVSFMFDNKITSKIKNDKIGRWRVELAQFKFDIKYRPGTANVGADTFSRIASVLRPTQELKELHEVLCHPGICRMHHYVRSKSLPYSLEEVKQVINSCKTCAELKPRFVKTNGKLINASAPMQRINIDFKGPLPTTSSNKQYLFTAIDEYSRYPFAYACKDTTSKTVKKCLTDIFSTFGMPDYIHNDRALDFLSKETTDYLHGLGIATSKTSRYNPRGNGQVERLNGSLWKAIHCTIHSQRSPLSRWEEVLPHALNSIRSLLCTATNQTPHERIFNYSRKTGSGNSLPPWLQEKPEHVLVKNHTRSSKLELPVVKAELIHANPQYAHVRLPSGTETTVSLREVAPCPESEKVETSQITNTTTTADNISPDNDDIVITDDLITHEESSSTHPANNVSNPRRSTRSTKPIERFADTEYSRISCMNCNACYTCGGIVM